jgi:DNA repair exonuclease SbcCD ATPase subunit
MKRGERLPGGLDTYNEYNKRTIRWYEEKIEELQRRNNVLQNDLEQTSNVLRRQQEQIARHQDDIIRLEEENRVLRVRMADTTTEEDGAPVLEHLKRQLADLENDSKRLSAARDALARQMGAQYGPRLAQLEQRLKAVLAQIEEKRAQLETTRGKWTVF